MDATLTALTRAGEAAPDDDTIRLAWLDALQEEQGETDFVLACREFIAKCGEKRRYRIVRAPTESAYEQFGATEEVSRRALPGWREWLGDAEVWRTVDIHADGTKGTWSLGATNWIRLVPLLWSLLGSSDRWRRKGATVEIEKQTNWERITISTERSSIVLRRARLTFARGFLARAEFRDWQSADALLPAILADQPFVEAGIRGLPSGNGHWIGELLCGPAWDYLEGFDCCLAFPKQVQARFEESHRARRALSDALKRRARGENKPHSSPTLPANGGDWTTPENPAISSETNDGD